jgi:excinuclease UvrABC helicase subunit UvrB
MLDNKPTITSKTIITNLILAVYGVLVWFKLLPAGLDTPEAIGVVVLVLTTVSSLFRKTATATLGSTQLKT